ncbi:hypothetical protein [Janibacter sp. G1551]|uniref:hypothetical protein n=1 Tax=Janibacter sp. G1551 TaxID=3420440 RepID=UPI003D0783CA
MSSPLKIVGAVLALAGLALAWFALPYATHLGSDGSAEFTAKPDKAGVVVIEPSVLNRVDTPVRITAKAADGREVWIGSASPSDAKAVLKTTKVARVTAVDVDGWSAATVTSGKAKAPDFAGIDLWRGTDTGKDSAELVIRQENAPETVIAASDGELTEVTLTWTRSSWFAMALAATLLGLALIGTGAWLILRGGRPFARLDRPTRDTDPAPRVAVDQEQ